MVCGNIWCGHVHMLSDASCTVGHRTRPFLILLAASISQCPLWGRRSVHSQVRRRSGSTCCTNEWWIRPRAATRRCCRSGHWRQRSPPSIHRGYDAGRAPRCASPRTVDVSIRALCCSRRAAAIQIAQPLLDVFSPVLHGLSVPCPSAFPPCTTVTLEPKAS